MFDWFPFDIRMFNDPTRAGSDGLCGHPNCPCEARWMRRAGNRWFALCTGCRYEQERQERMGVAS